MISVHKILWGSKIQTDHQIPAKTPNQVKLNQLKVLKKENPPNRGLCRPSVPLSEHRRKRKVRQVLRPCQTTQKAMEHEIDGATNCNWCTRKYLQ